MNTATSNSANAPSKYSVERVLRVHHWTERLFTITCTRNAAFRFMNGQFVMMGMDVAGQPIVRAYSMASANYEETLEFFSIKVDAGPLTSRLQHVRPGDPLLVGKRPTGTLTIGNLHAGERLWLLATGTGLAPFSSIIRDPETYERFERVILVHGCRFASDLRYAQFIEDDLRAHPLLGDLVRTRLLYYPSVTREPFHTTGRIPDLLASARVSSDLGLSELDPARDRVMLCGNPEMLVETSALLEKWGFDEGNSGEPGAYLVEKAFVAK